MSANSLLKTPMQLGDHVRFSHVFQRKDVFRNEINTHVQEWTPTPYADTHFGKQTNGVGIVTGIRTMPNGYTTYGEDGREWHATGSVTGYLVTYNLRRRPVYVPLDRILSRHW